ncbi:hypothetical protein [Chroococcidiopsis sp.]
MSVVSCQLSGSKEQGAESREQLLTTYGLRLTTSDLFLANYLLENQEV